MFSLRSRPCPIEPSGTFPLLRVEGEQGQHRKITWQRLFFALFVAVGVAQLCFALLFIIPVVVGNVLGIAAIAVTFAALVPSILNGARVWFRADVPTIH